MLILDNGGYVVASVPSGASTGTHEALELRDGDSSSFLGLGVQNAAKNVNEIIGPKIAGMDPQKQEIIDNALIQLDGTKNKTNLGANAILSVSIAVCKAGAFVEGIALYRYINKISHFSPPQKMPTPIFNLINGGLHGTGNLDFQEFHLIPASTKNFPEALKTGVEVYQNLKKVLARRGATHSAGDEGGFTPNLSANIDAFEGILEAVKETGLAPGKDIFLGLDAAANTFYKDGKYVIKDKNNPLSTDEIIEFYRGLLEQYRLIIIEDGLFEDDWGGWTRLTSELSSKTMIVGDDLVVTNKERLQKAISSKSVTGIIIKPNQIGTVTEAIQTIKMARDNGLQTIISHRSGETNDTFIADFSVGVADTYCKFGAPARGERVAKYNRLLAISQELGL
jgi:enolase